MNIADQFIRPGGKDMSVLAVKAPKAKFSPRMRSEKTIPIRVLEALIRATQPMTAREIAKVLDLKPQQVNDKVAPSRPLMQADLVCFSPDHPRKYWVNPKWKEMVKNSANLERYLRRSRIDEGLLG